MSFEPIAIIGRACIVPGALSPQQLWENVLAKKCFLHDAPEKLWRVDPITMLTDSQYPEAEHTWSRVGGYVEGFEQIFNSANYRIPPELIVKLDPILQWLLYVGREALLDANYDIEQLTTLNAGAILGNLMLPTPRFQELAEMIWLTHQDSRIISEKLKKQLLSTSPDFKNRFVSSLITDSFARALNLRVPVFTLDAACASGLYTIKYACDLLHDRRADIMLAGGINHADDLYTHVAFSTLQALSKTGQCRPLHQETDGIIPAEGAAIVVLKRLTDAIRDKNRILAVVRGVGLSNDGRARGFLVPSEEGQIAAIKQAYEIAELKPEDVSWVECHATGTSIGDATEIRSMKEIYRGPNPLSIGALKGNIGHLLTASASVAVIKVIEAFQAGIKPPTLFAPENPAEFLKDSHFQLHTEPTVWEVQSKSRMAAINAFGFGGNNAHMLIEEWQESNTVHQQVFYPSPLRSSKIAIVGIGVIASSLKSKSAFVQAINNNSSTLQTLPDGSLGGKIDNIELGLGEINFPPNSLKQTLGQQLAILRATLDAVNDAGGLTNKSKISAYIGMEIDSEICLHGYRWRLAELLKLNPQLDKTWIDTISQNIGISMTPESFLGELSNIIANRLNQQLNFKGPSFCIAADELAGVVALRLGCRALQQKEVDTAVVGAVDMCCEDLDSDLFKHILSPAKQIPGDAAVTFVLKRLDDAIADNDHIYAVLSDTPNNQPDYRITLSNEQSPLTPLFGYAYAASSLLYVLAAVLACDGQFNNAAKSEVNTAVAELTDMEGRQEVIYLESFKQ